MSERGALLIGVNNYDNVANLSNCVDDARAMADVLRTHCDGTVNFETLTMTTDKGPVTEAKLRQGVKRLFRELRGRDALFYFSGHGAMGEDGGQLMLQDTVPGSSGYAMAELLEEANNAGVGSIFLILDCCHSGNLGNTDDDSRKSQAVLAEGVTILAASSEVEEAQEGLEHSVFTELVLNALNGGAASIRGNVTAASIYAYVEQSLGFFQQTPMYKSHARRLKTIRECIPTVEDKVLRNLPTLFRAPFSKVQMNPSYEYTTDEAVPEHVQIFNDFKALRNAGLLLGEETVDGNDLYWVAIHSASVYLTPMGQYYWQLAKKGRLGRND